MKKAIIFDLDGTLLNSLVDIADAVNFVLKKNGFKEYTFEDYKQFIGNGIEVLARKALPTDITEEQFQKLFSEIQSSYKIRQNTRTAPYDGILELLKELNSLAVKISILSNKPHEFVGPTVERYFKDIRFELAFGSRKGVARKPNPEAVYEILETLKIEKTDCLFVGDTSTDINTGKNAGMETLGVTWGFRDFEELKNSGATFIIDKPRELLNIL